MWVAPLPLFEPATPLAPGPDPELPDVPIDGGAIEPRADELVAPEEMADDGCW